MENSIYNSLTEWRNANPKAFRVAIDKNLIDKICNIYGWEYKKRKPNGYWTLEKCKEEAKKYKSRKEWRMTPKSGYQIDLKNKWTYDKLNGKI